MAIQSTVNVIGDGVTYPSTKTIATKQHMAVWVFNPDIPAEAPNFGWSFVDVTAYDLVNNAAVITDPNVLVGMSQIEIRVVDNPNELEYNPTENSIVAGIAAEITTVAGIAVEVVIVSDNVTEVAAVADNIADVTIVADNINSVNNVSLNMDSVTTVSQNMVRVALVGDNIDDVVICADNIQAIIDALGHAQAAQLSMWVSEAESMTSNAWAVTPEDVEVKQYTSNGDGTFTGVTVSNGYSSFHYMKKTSALAAGAITFVGEWDASGGNYPTTKPPEGTGAPLTQSDGFVISASGTMGGIAYGVGDWIIYNTDTTWTRIPNATDWGDITNIPDNVTNALNTKGGTMTGQIKTIIPVLDADAANKKYVDDSMKISHEELLPVGSIIMFSGSIIGLSSLWAFCDGTNGTPDLRAQFIRGASDQASIGDTGGSDAATMPNHTHTGPSHTHTGPNHRHTGPSHTHTANHNHSASSGTAGAHSHTVVGSNAITAYALGSSAVGSTAATKTTSTHSGHSHSVTVNTTNFSTGSGGTGVTGYEGTGNTGSSGTGATGSAGGTGDNMPAYYALAYIMRIA